MRLAFALVFLLMAARGTALAESPCGQSLPFDLPSPPDELLFGSKMQRTMALLATSNPSRRHTVKILVYGQSISRALDDSCLEPELRRRFPHADLIFENRSISGFSATQLVRSAAVDIPLSYPDLVIFHDYGVGSTDYERMLADIRRRTTAEIMIWTDHYGNAGVPGEEERQARIDREDAAADIVRALAIKYNCELVDARRAWKRYLDENDLKNTDLLKDNVHLNEHGAALMTALLLQHFRLNLHASNNWMDTVRSYEAKRQADEGSGDGIIFSGKPWRIRKERRARRRPAIRAEAELRRQSHRPRPRHFRRSRSGFRADPHRWARTLGASGALCLYLAFPGVWR